MGIQNKNSKERNEKISKNDHHCSSRNHCSRILRRVRSNGQPDELPQRKPNRPVFPAARLGGNANGLKPLRKLITALKDSLKEQKDEEQITQQVVCQFKVIIVTNCEAQQITGFMRFLISNGKINFATSRK